MYKFKKIASVLASAVMLSSTVGLAAATTYPQPFVSSAGVADAAIVYGSHPAASVDLVSAMDIYTSLSGSVSSTGTTGVPEDCEAEGLCVQLSTNTNKFNLGNELDDFYSTIDESELTVLLAEGEYKNDDNTPFDYEQSIILGPRAMTHFTDSSYDDDTPTIGFDMTSGNFMMNYTLKFTPTPADGVAAGLTKIDGTYLPLMGRDYYVSAATTTANGWKLTLLDSANSATVTEGETTTVTVGDTKYDVSIVFIDDTDAILDVNDVETNKLAVGETFKLADDTYIAVQENLYNAKDSGISKLQFGIGTGQIVLEAGQEVKLNGKTINELYSDHVVTSYITNSSAYELNNIVLEWVLDDDVWLTPTTDLVFPGFETLTLSMGDFQVDKKEITKLSSHGDDSIQVDTFAKDGPVKFDILYLNSSSTGFAGLGEKTTHKLVTSSITGTTAVAVQVDLNETENSYFVATWISGDDAESYVYEIGSITSNSGKNTTTLTNLAGGSDMSFSEVGDTDNNEIQYTLISASDDNKVATINFTASSGNVYANRFVTAEGLWFRLPVDTLTAVSTLDGNINLTAQPTTWNMNFTEEDKDGNIMAAGTGFIVDMAIDSSNGAEVNDVSITDYETEDNSRIWVGYRQTDLATKTTINKPSSGLNDLEIEYHGNEAFSDIYLTSSSVILGGTTTSILVPVKDTDSYGAKNVVVVGGSCVNSLAAELLGSSTPLCGDSWATATNVNAGQYLIQSFTRSGKVATLVAGYNAGDTTIAATAFTTQTPDTTAGSKYIGTTATDIGSVITTA